MAFKVLITGPFIAPEAIALLERHGGAVTMAPEYSDMPGLMRKLEPDAVILRQGIVDAAALDAFPGLRIVAKHGAGYNTIDVDAATTRGIVVTVTASANARPVAEHAMALMLAVVKQILPLDRGLRNGKWEKPSYRGDELCEKNLGLVGFGAIGRKVAAMASAFDMTVSFFDPGLPEGAATGGARRHTDLDQLLAGSDIVSLHCPLTPETRGLLSRARIARMKPGAILINSSRGEVTDEAALIEALREGRIAAAGIDCFAAEPPGSDHPYWALPNVVVTPHIGGATHASFRRMGLMAARCVLGCLEGSGIDPDCVLNPTALREAG